MMFQFKLKLIRLPRRCAVNFAIVNYIELSLCQSFARNKSCRIKRFELKL